MAGGQDVSTSGGDPEIREFNRLRLGELQRTLPMAGGLPGITAFRPGALPGGEELGFLRRIMETAGRSVGTQDIVSNIGRFFQGLLPQATQGFQQAFEGGVVPSIVNRLTAAGLGRSGATGEAIAQAGQQALVPLVQQAMQGATGLGTQFLPGAVDLSRLPIALQAAGAPRQARFAEESRRGNILLQLLSSMNLQPSGAGQQIAVGKPDFLTPIMGGLGAGAGALGTILASPTGAASLASLFSDSRLKTNVEHVGYHKAGLPLYEYDIFGERRIGVMADEAALLYPGAVGVGPGGYLMVDYRALPR